MTICVPSTGTQITARIAEQVDGAGQGFCFDHVEMTFCLHIVRACGIFVHMDRTRPTGPEPMTPRIPLVDSNGFVFTRSQSGSYAWHCPRGSAQLTAPDRPNASWFYQVHSLSDERQVRGGKRTFDEAIREAVFWLGCFGMMPDEALPEMAAQSTARHRTPVD